MCVGNRTRALRGADEVAAALGVGTIYVRGRTAFGYFAALTVLLGGVLSLLFSLAYPGSRAVALIALVVAGLGAVAIAAATALRRDWAPHVALGVLVLGSAAVAYLVLTAPVASPGWALDPRTHVPVATAFPGYARVLSPPFNIAGALSPGFGAISSAYLYMPKRKVLAAGRVRAPSLAHAS